MTVPCRFARRARRREIRHFRTVAPPRSIYVTAHSQVASAVPNVPVSMSDSENLAVRSYSASRVDAPTRQAVRMRRLLARIDRLEFAQRLALTLGFEAALVVVGLAITAPDPVPGGGWFGYAPNTRVTFSPGGYGGTSRLATAAVWLGLIVIGTVVAVRFLRRGGANR